MPKTINCCIEQSLTLPSKGPNIALFRHFVSEFVRDCGFDETEIFDIVLATGEACSNAFQHGSPLKGENNITVVCKCSRDTLEIRIHDEGIFKKEASMVTDTSDVRGRGIMIMLSLMDKIEIDENTTGTTVCLVKKHKLKDAVFESSKTEPAINKAN